MECVESVNVCECVCVRVCACVWDLFLLLRVKPQKPQTKQLELWFQFFGARGVWHLHPTTLNEAVDPSGRQDLIPSCVLCEAAPCGVKIREGQAPCGVQISFTVKREGAPGSS